VGYNSNMEIKKKETTSNVCVGTSISCPMSKRNNTSIETFVTLSGQRFVTSDVFSYS